VPRRCAPRSGALSAAARLKKSPESSFVRQWKSRSQRFAAPFGRSLRAPISSALAGNTRLRSATSSTTWQLRRRHALILVGAISRVPRAVAIVATGAVVFAVAADGAIAIAVAESAIVTDAEALPPLPSLVQCVCTPPPLRGALCASSARAPRSGALW